VRTTMPPYESMVSIVPEGASAEARVTHFNVTAEEARWSEMRATVTGRRDLSVRQGRYAKLEVGGMLMMTDTQMEQASNLDVIIQARGDVLIAGLGLGLIVLPIARKRDVARVTVVEHSPGVIDLVEAPLRQHLTSRVSRKLAVVPGDIFKWRPEQPGRQFDTIYFDIWADYGTHAKEAVALRRAFARYLRKDGWIGAWKAR